MGRHTQTRAESLTHLVTSTSLACGLLSSRLKPPDAWGVAFVDDYLYETAQHISLNMWWWGREWDVLTSQPLDKRINIPDASCQNPKCCAVTGIPHPHQRTYERSLGSAYERHIPACDLKTLASSLLTSPIIKRCLDASDKKHNRAHICIITLRNTQPPRQAH